ncbi:MAG TPA: D-glycero-beta-D-manno-heptose-7-phosphate kinase [Candidatus Kapabacteria bacterium]|nr:D-glycero-beta-D-manno-heptose-7-phosphate kinase [Candidatus Kapabacteria bacterium]HPP40094.1 D-glycero-beta-D-manno-heptose-7-phosphate kinase [Candidatus Kapabacteria bacterium]
MLNLSVDRAKEIIQNVANRRIAVIGDVMLDRYFWGSVSRVSPEAPVPVVDLESETFHLGGAANVAANLKSLGARPYLFGVLGCDKFADIFIDISQKIGIEPSGLFQDGARPTTLKTRIIGNNQQLLRLDLEKRTAIDKSAIDFIIRKIEETDDFAAIILQDYNKGAITAELIHLVIEFAKSKSIPVFVDPKFANFFEYNEVTLFKPNKREAELALNLEIKSDEALNEAGNQLLSKLKADNVLITLGSEGMRLFKSNGEIKSVPTRARKVADVSGAGDTVIATLAATYSAGATVEEAATLANFAAGVVCEEPGIVSVQIDKLINAVKIFSE